MSRMSTDENIELHITASADDILEVSPVNSYINSNSEFSPRDRSGSSDDSGSSGSDDDNSQGDGEPSESITSPTESLRHRRSQQMNAFSSSSEGSSKGNYDDDDNDGISNGNGDYDYDDDDSAGSSSGSGSSTDSGSETDSRRQQPPSSQQQQQQHVSSSNKNDQTSTNTNTNTNIDHPDNSGILPPSSSSSPSQQQSQQQPRKKGRAATPQSEFDKALLTGVPSRGYATSFFSADSADSADGATVPTTTAVEDALSAAIMAASAGAGGAADPSSIPQQQLAPSRTGSWDEAATDVTTSSSSAKPHRITQQQQQNPPKKEKERKAHRVNITTTTQSAPTPAIIPSTTAAPASSLNNYPPPPPSSHAKSSAPSYTTAGSAALKNKPKKTNSNSNASSFESSGGAPLHAPNNNGNNNKNNNTNTYDNGDHIQDLSSGVLPDVLMTMRQKIESMQLFDSDMMKLAEVDSRHMDEMDTETRAALKRSSQQSISAAVLVSLAHKRYERRRLAAMEIEKVVRSLVQQNELERVRAILLLLSDDYVRSTSEDARKGGVVALAACAIGLKKAHDKVATVMECRDLVLASVVHACQDHSQRVRYYATESLFNVVKVIPGLAVQHFFILFEILRSLWADVDGDVRSGAELLDKKLKEVILGAVNSGSFSTDACVPVFARFVYMRNKATKKLTLSWLQELNEKLIGAPILEFLHLFLGGIFDMVADPSTTIRQAALAFLQSVLPKLLVVNSEAIDDMDDAGMKVDFDSILQSLVTTMEHPDPFVRKVAMFWVSRIVKAHMKELHARSQASNNSSNNNGKQPSSNSSSPTMMNPDGRLSPTKKSSEADNGGGSEDGSDMAGGGEDNTSSTGKSPQFKAASISVRNSLPHVLPGILLSIGDTFKAKGARDSFLPDQTTNQLAEETNACLRDAVRRDGKSYVQHLDSFIVALREELSSPGGLNSRNPPAEERKLYRLDVKPDGTGIESPGWFRASNEAKERNEESMVSSRLCALHWIIVLYESVVPDQLKAEYAREFIIPIIHQLVDNPPERIVFKSLEVLAKITVPVLGEDHSRLDQGTPRNNGTSSLSGFNTPQPAWASPSEYSPDAKDDDDADFPMTDANASFALDILHPSRRKFKSRDREVFTALIQLHSYNQQLLVDLSRVIAYMCKLQPAEFVFVSFAVELDRFVRRLQKQRTKQEESNLSANSENTQGNQVGQRPFSSNLEFVSSFVEQMCHGLLNADEAQPLRDTLRDCVGFTQSSGTSAKVHRAVRLFHIMLHSFSHSIVATVSLCLWGGAYRTASMFLARIVPLDINLMFLLELDKLVEQLERPLFRHLHVRMLERDIDPKAEGSGAMLFETLKFLLMIIPQSTCYNVLKERVASISRFRQSTGMMPKLNLGIRTDQNEADTKRTKEQTDVFVERVLKVRATHCDAMWHTIRSESLESQPLVSPNLDHEEGESRRRWLGYASKEEQQKAEERYRREKQSQHQGSGLSIEELDGYQDLGEEPTDSIIEQQLNEKFERETNRLMMEESEHDNPPALRQDATSEEQAQDDGAWKAYWEDD